MKPLKDKFGFAKPAGRQRAIGLSAGGAMVGMKVATSMRCFAGMRTKLAEERLKIVFGEQ
jgi:hypothetical protein